MVVPYRQGGPVPDYAEGDARRCPNCGGVHVLLIEEVVVTTREDVEAARARYGEDTV
jgi:hypothetical protein